MQRGGPALSERRPLGQSITSESQPGLAVLQSVTLPINFSGLTSFEVFRRLNFHRSCRRNRESFFHRVLVTVEAMRDMKSSRSENSLGNARRRRIWLYRFSPSPCKQGLARANV